MHRLDPEQMRACANMFIPTLVFSVVLLSLFAVLVATAGSGSVWWGIGAVIGGVLWAASFVGVIFTAVASVLDRRNANPDPSLV